MGWLFGSKGLPDKYDKKSDLYKDYNIVNPDQDSEFVKWLRKIPFIGSIIGFFVDAQRFGINYWYLIVLGVALFFLWPFIGPVLEMIWPYVLDVIALPYQFIMYLWSLTDDILGFFFSDVYLTIVKEGILFIFLELCYRYGGLSHLTKIDAFATIGHILGYIPYWIITFIGSATSLFSKQIGEWINYIAAYIQAGFNVVFG